MIFTTYVPSIYQRHKRYFSVPRPIYLLYYIQKGIFHLKYQLFKHKERYEAFIIIITTDFLTGKINFIVEKIQIGFKRKHLFEKPNKCTWKISLNILL